MDSETAQVAIKTVLSILAIVDIIGNSLVCVVIVRNQDMRIPINYLLVNLAVADMMVAIFFAPMYIFINTFTHPDGVTGTVLCRLLTGGSLAWVGGACSAFTLVAIAVERYYAVNYPHDNRGKLTDTKLKASVLIQTCIAHVLSEQCSGDGTKRAWLYNQFQVIIPASWIFALTMEIPEFLSLDYDKTIASCTLAFTEEWMGKAYSVLWFLMFGGLPIPLMLALYSTVVYNLWFKRNDQNELTYQQKGVLKVRKRVTLMVVTVSIIFSICWLTDAIIFLMSYHSTTNSPSDVTWAIAAVMILFNSASNPFVYGLINHRFREKIKGMACGFTYSKNRVRATSEVLDIQATNSTTQATQMADVHHKE